MKFAPEIRLLDRAALFWRVGTGKTRADIEDSMWLYCHDKIDAHLVIAPAGVHRAWIEEQMPTWLTIPAKTATFRSKSNAAREEWRGLEAFVDQDGYRVLAMYYEAFASQTGFDFAKNFVQHAGRVKITVDESHRIKAPGSLASQRIAKLRDHSVVRRIMTATPTGNGLEDLYAQFRFLGMDILDCSTFAEYKGMFVHEVQVQGTNFKKITGYRNVKYLNKRLAPYVFVAKKPEGLPPQHWNTVYTEMSDEQLKAYTDMKLDYQTQLRTGPWVDGELAITRIKRLQQIAAGHLPIPQEGDERKVREVLELACPRVQDTIDVVRGCPDKVILWAEEQFEITRLVRELRAAGIGCLPYFGGIKQDQRDANKRAFEEDVDIKVMVANPATGGTGLTIVGKVAPVGDAIYYSHNWSYLSREQSEGRNHRPGITADRVIYTDMICAASMDPKIRRRVRNKEDIAKLVEDPRSVAALLDESLDYRDTSVSGSLFLTN